MHAGLGEPRGQVLVERMQAAHVGQDHDTGRARARRDRLERQELRSVGGPQHDVGGPRDVGRSRDRRQRCPRLRFVTHASSSRSRPSQAWSCPEVPSGKRDPPSTREVSHRRGSPVTRCGRSSCRRARRPATSSSTRSPSPRSNRARRSSGSVRPRSPRTSSSGPRIASRRSRRTRSPGSWPCREKGSRRRRSAIPSTG